FSKIIRAALYGYGLFESLLGIFIILISPVDNTHEIVPLCVQSVLLRNKLALNFSVLQVCSRAWPDECTCTPHVTLDFRIVWLKLLCFFNHGGGALRIKLTVAKEVLLTRRFVIRKLFFLLVAFPDGENSLVNCKGSSCGHHNACYYLPHLTYRLVHPS